MSGNLINETKSQLRGMRKANIDAYPQSLLLYCNTLEIHSDGTPQHTSILIDGKPAHGVYSLKINLNTQRATKIEIGAFLDDFTFDLRPRKE
jgi:hypothetical protein